MSNQRTTFLKRQREQNRKDKAKAKQERLAARRAAALNAPEEPPIVGLDGPPPAPDAPLDQPPLDTSPVPDDDAPTR
jgi:hypothetical protein